MVLIELDVQRGTLRRVAATDAAPHPSFVAVSPGGTQAYVVSEVGAMEAGGSARGETGALLSLALQDGGLALTGTVDTGSTEPCHVVVAPDGRHAVVSNYRGGAVSVVALDPEGPVRERSDLVQHRGSSVDPDRQEGPNAHSATFDLSGERVLVCDLGLDRVLFYRLDDDTGRLQALPALDIPTPAGTGPRHLDFHPDGQRLYVAGGLNSTLLVYRTTPTPVRPRSCRSRARWVRRSRIAGIIRPTCTSTPPGGSSTSPTEELDSIAVFTIDERDGRVELQANLSGGGRVPRNFAINPTGHLLLCANQGTDTVVPFWIDRTTGLFEQAADPLALGSPVCLRFLRS